VLSPLAGALRLASVVLCLIVVVSFVLFVVDQTSSASAHQQAIVNAAAPGSPAAAAQHSGTSRDGESSVRSTIDDASEAITSPFSFATEHTSSEWLSRGIALVLTLLIYGFVLSYAARTIRVRL
jgi:predicted PurR-regulated permease PerM